MYNYYQSVPWNSFTTCMTKITIEDGFRPKYYNPDKGKVIQADHAARFYGGVILGNKTKCMIQGNSSMMLLLLSYQLCPRTPSKTWWGACTMLLIGRMRIGMRYMMISSKRQGMKQLGIEGSYLSLKMHTTEDGKQWSTLASGWLLMKAELLDDITVYNDNGPGTQACLNKSYSSLSMCHERATKHLQALYPDVWRKIRWRLEQETP